MRNIILASSSRPRRAILRQMGLRFKSVPPRVKEKRRLTKGCKALVIGNALRKAKGVAAGYSSGIVIGADTVCRSGGKIIGKPKNKKEAAAILKFISRRPCEFYTGLAVIDIDSRSVYKDCEKTTLHIRPLSDRDIKVYLHRPGALARAGGFDIQGPGGGFVRRAEGCRYNVAGLPVGKLNRILKMIRDD